MRFISAKTGRYRHVPRLPFPAGVGIALRYALDHSHAGDFSRITLKVGNSLLARAYVSANGTALAPAGAWTFPGVTP